MPRYAWDGFLADGLVGEHSPRARSCDATVLTLPPQIQGTSGQQLVQDTLPAADQSLHASRPCPSPSPSVASGRSQLLSDPERPPLTPQRLAVTPMSNARMATACGLGQARPAPRVPQVSSLDSLVLQRAPGTPSTSGVGNVRRRSSGGGACEARPSPATTPPSSSPGTFGSPVSTGSGGAARRSSSGIGEAASGVVASTVGLVSELQSSAKCLLAELENKDSEVRVLRQALLDLARESGSSKNLRELLGPARAEELDAQQKVPLHSTKKCHERPIRQRERRSPGGACTCDCEFRISELRAELDESLAKLAEAESREKKTCEEMESLRRVAMHYKKKSQNMELTRLDLERCRMDLEDRMSRQLQAPLPSRERTGCCLLPLPRSASRGSDCSGRGKRRTSSFSPRTPPRTPPMPSRLSTCSSSGAPTPPEEALQQAEALVLQMFDLPGARSVSRSPAAGSRSPPSGHRSNAPRSPRSSMLANTIELDSFCFAASKKSPPPSAARPLCEEASLLPPPLPKAQSDPIGFAATTSSAAGLRPINGTMPRFPSAELGSPKPVSRALQEQGATRRRSCPLFTESSPSKASGTPLRRSTTVGDAIASDTPKRRSGLTSALAQPSERTPVEKQLQGNTDFEFSLKGDFGVGLRDVGMVPVSLPSTCDDHAVQVARIVAARMSGSPENSSWPEESPKAKQVKDVQDEAPSSSPQRRNSKSRFSPVNVPATRLSELLPLHPPGQGSRNHVKASPVRLS
jgi:hypothetical protein